MPYRKDQFANSEIYHIISRSVNGMTLFNDEDDYYRMIFSIYELNNSLPTTIRERREERNRFKKQNRSPSSESFWVDKRDNFLEILSFCFMPNHFHLLVRQLKDSGITKFMSKIGTGYAGYFNRKYNRKGYVFQNRFKSIHVASNDYLKTLFAYIHTNPISLLESNWKELGVKEPQKAINFLENKYKWSSYQDFIGKSNFPSVTERKFLHQVIGSEIGCKSVVQDWIFFKNKISSNQENLQRTGLWELL